MRRLIVLAAATLVGLAMLTGVAQAKPVTLGPLVDGLRVIRTGLAANDNIVLDGLANPMVRPGAKVQPQKGEIKTADAKAK